MAKEIDQPLSVRRDKAVLNFERHYAVCNECEDGYNLCSVGKRLRRAVRGAYCDNSMYATIRRGRVGGGVPSSNS